MFKIKNDYIKTNLKIAWPIAINALLMQGMLMIDTLLISPLGENALVSMGIASTIIALMLGVQNALANGSQNILSRAVGSKKDNLVSKTFLSALIINLSFSIFFFLFLVVFKWPIIKLISHNVNLYNDIDAYLSVIQYTLILTSISQVAIITFNAMGRSKIPLMSYIFSMPINAVLSYYLIHGFDTFSGMGIKGAAIGSVISLVLGVIFLLIYLRYQNTIKLSFKKSWEGIGKNIYQHFIEIFPIAANIVILSLGLVVYNFIYAQLPTELYAAVVMITPWLTSLTQFVVAWAVSSSIIISQSIGANSLDSLKNNVNLSIKVTIGVSIMIAFISFLLSLVIHKIYPGHSAVTYEALKSIAPLYILMPLIQGYVTVHGQMLRALGKTKIVFNINFVTRWIIALPLFAVVVLLLNASIFWVYAVTVLEQILKIPSMRYHARKFLADFDTEKAKKLMYD